VLGSREVILTSIITELNHDEIPIVPEVQQCDSTVVQLSITPVFIE